MANDPGLSGDTCIYMEAVAGDGGVHNSSGVWWLSPDIQLVGPTSGPDKADPGVVNPVTVTARRKSDEQRLHASSGHGEHHHSIVGRQSVSRHGSE